MVSGVKMGQKTKGYTPPWDETHWTSGSLSVPEGTPVDRAGIVPVNVDSVPVEPGYDNRRRLLFSVSPCESLGLRRRTPGSGRTSAPGTGRSSIRVGLRPVTKERCSVGPGGPPQSSASSNTPTPTPTPSPSPCPLRVPSHPREVLHLPQV